MNRTVLSLLLLMVLPASATAAEEFRMIAFNIERGYKSDAELATVTKIMSEIGPADVWALSEVSANDQAQILQSLGGSYEAVRGTRGDDYLLLVYDSAKFSLVADGEVYLTELLGGQRKPLWIKLQATNSGTELFVLANHFMRGGAMIRVGWGRLRT